MQRNARSASSWGGGARAWMHTIAPDRLQAVDHDTPCMVCITRSFVPLRRSCGHARRSLPSSCPASNSPCRLVTPRCQERPLSISSGEGAFVAMSSEVLPLTRRGEGAGGPRLLGRQARPGFAPRRIGLVTPRHRPITCTAPLTPSRCLHLGNTVG